MLHHSGKLLVKVVNRSFAAVMGGPNALTINRFTTRALSPLPAAPAFDANAIGDQWLQATPAAGAAYQNPWDLAHQTASAQGYAEFMEPDLLNLPATPLPVPASQEADPSWPPATFVSPAWHLQDGFTGFLDVRAQATGKGVRIAHLDTGYADQHVSKPRNLRPDLGWNFYEGNSSTIDPATTGLLDNPGHGPATIAILAGNTVSLADGGQIYNGDFGGAPDAEVVPVRVGPSVVHFYTAAVAQGLNWAIAPANDTANRCDVVTLSHGGVPSAAWADAVNACYDAGIVVVAASGDNVSVVVPLPTHSTVYPSAFGRVITVTGATYDKTPYVTHGIGKMQGNWGPDIVMKKAVASFTPNIAKMVLGTTNGFYMNFGGTSASTPQVAAACALWIQLYGASYPANWQRVEACRLALFESVQNPGADTEHIGRGILNVPAMLDSALAARIQALMAGGTVQPMQPDSVSFGFWRTLFNIAPPNSAEDAMYDLEVAQILHRSTQPELATAFLNYTNTGVIDPTQAPRLRTLLAAEPDISNALTAKIAAIQAAPPAPVPVVPPPAG
ncbi:Subtilase family protein [Granulicella rosea]|uniref:Subtilase family protein n=1 Tax=Granulicella rosea TaxID=474952 RepID=A0A239KWX2_9BACT|nr:S8/S53 family peptidase [Granulicella rosea]SNT22009.1 Subtilase family protein [Granulicella rosea]